MALLQPAPEVSPCCQPRPLDCPMHLPSVVERLRTQVYNLFDEVLLMSEGGPPARTGSRPHQRLRLLVAATASPTGSTAGLKVHHACVRAGRTIFHGPLEDVVPFFDSLGFRCPDRKGIPDFLQGAPLPCQCTSSAAQPCCLCALLHRPCSGRALTAQVHRCSVSCMPHFCSQRRCARADSSCSCKGPVCSLARRAAAGQAAGVRQAAAASLAPFPEPRTCAQRSRLPRTSSSTGRRSAPGSLCPGTPLWRPSAAAGRGRPPRPSWRSPLTPARTGRMRWCTTSTPSGVRSLPCLGASRPSPQALDPRRAQSCRSCGFCPELPKAFPSSRQQQAWLPVLAAVVLSI